MGDTFSCCCYGAGYVENLRRQIVLLENQVKETNGNISTLNDKIKERQIGAGAELQKISNTQQKGSNASKQITETTTDARSRESKIASLQQQLQQQQSTINFDNDEITRLRGNIQALKNERNNFNSQLASLKAEAGNIRNKEAELLRKNAEIEQLRRKLAEATSDMARKEAELVELRKRESDLRRSKDSVEKQLARTKYNLEIAHGNLEMANKKVDVERDIQSKQGTSIAELNAKKNEAERALSQAENARQSAENACLLADQQITKLKREMQQIRDNYVEKDTIKKNKSECEDLKREKDSLSAYVKELEKEIRNIKSQLVTNPSPVSPPSSSATLFFGPALQGNDDYKVFLVSLLERKIGLKIAKTVLLYSYDPLNKTNVHKYIDDKENLVVIVKTVEGYLFGGWSVEGLTRRKSTRDGLLFSLTNQRVYPLVAGKQAVTYDDFYIIFGNSEIRIRSNEGKVFSNFGISNGYYSNNGDRVNTLIGSSQREIPIERYDVFQLQLKEN